MKKMKKTALMLAGAMSIGVLGGCGGFDASGYLKALMDNSYKNDSAAFVEMKIGTAEEAATLYEQGIDTEVASILSGSGVSAELEAEYHDLLSNIFSQVKYNVKDAEKQSDGTYVVTVEYEQMQVFGPAIEAYTPQAETLQSEWATAETAPSTEEMMEQIFGLLKDCLNDAASGVTYAEPATTTVRIELNNNVYSPNEQDIYNLELVLFDIDKFAEM